MNGYNPTSLITIDSTKVNKDKLKALEAILYGSDGVSGSGATNPKLPLPDEVVATLKA